jgi:outer membrane murein-binding lipoprotein Lpp
MDDNGQVVTKADLLPLKTDVGVLKADVGVLKADVGVLKADVGALKADVGALKADVGALKADVGVLKNDVGALKTDLVAMESRFEGRMDAREQRIRDDVREAIHDSETRLLQAFYGFAETNNRRLIQMEAGDAFLVNRVVTLEGRVLEIEKRLNLPPAS